MFSCPRLPVFEKASEKYCTIKLPNQPKIGFLFLSADGLVRDSLTTVFTQKAAFYTVSIFCCCMLFTRGGSTGSRTGCHLKTVIAFLCTPFVFEPKFALPMLRPYFPLPMLVPRDRGTVHWLLTLLSGDCDESSGVYTAVKRLVWSH